jgi:glycosyltransferase involved in cell wall biosynthesis
VPNLLFCMTPGVSLNTWKKIGSIKRELKPYKEYVRNGWNVKVLTFDKSSIPDLPEGIEAVPFRHRQLLWFLPWTHKELGKWADVIKTNQSHHAYFYTRAARHWKKPILLRCGYVHGEYLETVKGYTCRTRLYQWLEMKAFRSAAHCQLPTVKLAEWVRKRYELPRGKISVIPNFVDTDLFKPAGGIKLRKKTVVSVGRLSRVKRFHLLIEACAGIFGCELTIVGEGVERAKLEQQARELGLKLTLTGYIENESLVRFLQEHSVFAIVSEWEGHPKALIEAMSCGMPCVGVSANGINEVICNGDNGLLVGLSLDSLREGISSVFKDNKFRKKLSENARNSVIQKYSFKNCFSRERCLLESIIEKAPMNAMIDSE